MLVIRSHTGWIPTHTECGPEPVIAESYPLGQTDADFIAHAPTDIAALLADNPEGLTMSSEGLRREQNTLTLDEAGVERLAAAVCGAWHPWVLEEVGRDPNDCPWYSDHASMARAIVEALRGDR